MASLGTGVCPWPTCGQGSHIPLLGSTCQMDQTLWNFAEKGQGSEPGRHPTQAPLHPPAEQRVPRRSCRRLTGQGLAGLPRAALKKTLCSGSIEQTFIEHLSARHCARCHGKYRVNTDGPCPQGAHSLEREVRHRTRQAAVTPARQVPKARHGAAGVTEHHGVASGPKQWARYQVDTGLGLGGGSHLGEGVLRAAGGARRGRSPQVA